MRVYLIGYMGVGKTTQGRKIASRLGLDFVDLDEFISSEEGQDVAEIIQERGEPEFRVLEGKYLKVLSNQPNVVISTGGGTPCFFDNMVLMNSTGITVFFSLKPEIIVNRVKNRLEKRPLLHGKTKEELLEFIKEHLGFRMPYYEQASIHFDTSNTSSRKIDELISDILERN